MTAKQFVFIKKIAAIIVAIAVGVSVVNNNFFIPLLVVALAGLTLFYLKSRVKEVMVDERDFKIAGRAAFLAIQIHAWLMTIGMFIFYSQKDVNPAFGPIAFTLAYSTCALLILYAAIFKLHDKIFKNKA